MGIFEKTPFRYQFVIMLWCIHVLLVFAFFHASHHQVFQLTWLPTLLIASSLGIQWGLSIGVFFWFVTNPILKLILDTSEPVEYYFSNHVFSICSALICIWVIGQQSNSYQKCRDATMQLKEASRSDPLTGLLNRRSLIEYCRQLIKRTHRIRRDTEQFLPPIRIKPQDDHKKDLFLEDYLGTFAIAILEIDAFKDITSRYGNEAANRTLLKVSDLMKETVIFRESDIKGRFGLDTFLVILPDTSATNAEIPLKKLKKSLEETPFVSPNEEVFYVSFSAGLTQLCAEDREVDDLLRRADQALYEAKQSGGGQIVNWDQPEE